MAYQAKIDWDNVDVGNSYLDHSENFFSKKHFGHERFDGIEIQCADDNERSELFDMEELFKGFKIEIVKCDAAYEDANKENIDNTITIKEEPVRTPEDKKYEALPKGEKNTLELPTKPSAQAKKIVNLACQWSTQKTIACKSVAASKGAVSKSMPPPPPHAYLVKDHYQRKREEAARRCLEEERKKRVFHSRPVPNFNACHKLIEKRKFRHLFTVAITPEVLKKSKEAQEKQRMKLEESKKNHHAPKFVSRPPTVLKEKPFVPLKKPLAIQQAPFNLSIEKRLIERKHYDEAIQKMLEEKKKEEEKERKRRDEECIRELRKATIFKARPNPFKH